MNFRNFIRNVPLFLRLAWNWRSWDADFTIEVFKTLLLENGKACRDDRWHFYGRKKYSQAAMAVDLLDKAYKYESKSGKYLDNKYPLKLKFLEKHFNVSRAVELYRENNPSPLALKLVDYSYNKEIEMEEKLKKEAWEYVGKHIDRIWS